MSKVREKFATQVDAELLAELRALASDEGRQIQAIVEEAFSDLLERRRQESPRSHVMKAYNKSHDKYASLYEKLAK